MTENPTVKIVPDISLVVVNYNTGHLLARMFAALHAATASLDIDIIVVDNASSDDSVAIVESKFPTVTLIKNSTNVGFGRANNQAIPHVNGRYVLLLNTDAFVATDTLEKTVAFMDEHPRCGVLGVKLVGETAHCNRRAATSQHPGMCFCKEPVFSGSSPRRAFAAVVINLQNRSQLV